MTCDRRVRDVGMAALVPMLLALGALSAYLGALTLSAWRAVYRGRARTVTSLEPVHRFVVLVPAHDEEQLLARTLDSLEAMAYPATHVRVHVVADNCTDATAQIAHAAGVEVHERHDPQRPGKGPALAWLLQRLWDRGDDHDAVAVIDADTVVAPDFLHVMDARLARGERVVQGHYAVLDPDASWPVALRYAALAARHYLRPLGRTSWGGSAGLHGNGMVFAADVLRRHPWGSHLTEDIELEARLLLDGLHVTFAPDARIEAEMPADLAQGTSQHARWERGRLDVARRYVPRLLRAAATEREPATRLRLADAALDHLVPPLSALAALTLVASGLSGGLRAWRATPASRVAVPVVVGAAGVQAVYVASALRMVDAPPTVWRALLRAPLYVVWRLWTWLRPSRPQEQAWVRTARPTRPPTRSVA